MFRSVTTATKITWKKGATTTPKLTLQEIRKFNVFIAGQDTH